MYIIHHIVHHILTKHPNMVYHKNMFIQDALVSMSKIVEKYGQINKFLCTQFSHNISL